MKFHNIIFILILFLLTQISYGQAETYTITKAPFSSDLYDEFSPVVYKNGVVFCSNRTKGITSYSTALDKGFLKIYYIDPSGKVNWQDARLFSKELTSKLNDGPVTFNRTGDTVYFSRNLDVSGNLKEISSRRNKLGLFSAVLAGGEWTKIREMRFNNELYNITTPWLSPDGKRLFFASDKQGGQGGFDLYYSNWENGYWKDPVNLGPIVNTTGNESYPFINSADELFFSSDGHQGLGGKDIFYSKFAGNDWLPPVRLNAPVNSTYDDFGIVPDSLLSEGYFSSNRNNSIDIFHFKTSFPQIFYADIQKVNQYCFMFRDSGAIIADTLNLKYIWDFGDGNKTFGAVVKHCFPGPGTYNVKLDIIDRASGNLFFSKLDYILELRDFEQPFINSPAVAVIGNAVEFDALKSYNPGYEIISYLWDFDDGTKITGASVKHTFSKSGEYDIKLGVKLRSLTNGIIHNKGIMKKFTVFNTPQELTSYNAKRNPAGESVKDLRQYENARITINYSAENEFRKDALFRIEILSSKTRIGTGSNVFSNLQGKYFIKELLDSASGNYYYIADEQLYLMHAYPAFRELAGMGFKSIRLRMDVIHDPVGKELIKLKKNYGVLTDTYFDANNRLTANGYLLLDQIVILLNRNPGIRMEIAVHTDNQGVPANSLILSRMRAQTMVNYLINRGINSKRLIATGYGGSRPVASNNSTAERRLNRRIDITIE